MTKVVIDTWMSLGGFVAGPDDGRDHPLGRHSGMHLFDWCFSGNDEFRGRGEDRPNPTGGRFPA